MARKLIVEADRTFRITIPDEAKVTFGPWSPPTGKERWDEKSKTGTLRIYEDHSAKASVLAVYAGVTSYRDLAIEYEEQVTVEQGAVIWNSDRNGYSREENVTRSSDWEDPFAAPKALPEPKAPRARKATVVSE